MGIAGLFDFLRQRAPACMCVCSLHQFRGQRAAIDLSAFVYAWQSVGITNSEGEPVNHINGLLAQYLRLLRADITPIYVLDGVPPDAKKPTLEARRAQITRVQMARGIWSDVRELLELIGAKTVQAEGEAEAAACALFQERQVDFVVSVDSDALARGANVLVREVADEVKIVRLDLALLHLNLDMRQFREMCALMGSDYGPRIPGIGPVRAYELVQRYDTLRQIPNVTPEILAAAEIFAEKIIPPKPVANSKKLDKLELRLREWQIRESVIKNALEFLQRLKK